MCSVTFSITQLHSICSTQFQYTDTFSFCFWHSIEYICRYAQESYKYETCLFFFFLSFFLLFQKSIIFANICTFCISNEIQINSLQFHTEKKTIIITGLLGSKRKTKSNRSSSKKKKIICKKFTEPNSRKNCWAKNVFVCSEAVVNFVLLYIFKNFNFYSKQRCCVGNPIHKSIS